MDSDLARFEAELKDKALESQQDRKDLQHFNACNASGCFLYFKHCNVYILHRQRGPLHANVSVLVVGAVEDYTK